MNAIRLFVFPVTVAVAVFSENALAATYWGGEIPYVTSTVVEASVTENAGEYTYSYTVKSGTMNVGTIAFIDLDISVPYNSPPLTDTLASSPCYDKNMELSLVEPPPEGKPLVPAVAYCPDRWFSMLGSRQGVLVWGSGYTPINPGDVVPGFMVKSPGLPGIRTMSFKPVLVDPDADGSVTWDQIDALHKQVTYPVKTIGPTAPPIDVMGNQIFFIDTLTGYVADSQTLGWLTDPAFAATLTAKLAAVKAEVFSTDLSVDHSAPAKALLNDFMAMVQNATPSQMTLEAKGLLYYNARYLLSRLPHNPKGP